MAQGHPADQERSLDEQLTVRLEAGVLWLTLDRPEAANAVTPDQRNRLIGLLAEASERVDVRVVVLRGTGEHFCTGADLRAGRSGRHGVGDAAADGGGASGFAGVGDGGGLGAGISHGPGATDAAGGGRDIAPERVVGDVARLIRQGAQRLIAAVLDCEKPVVAAVNGTAAGLGAHLALACDLVVASEKARFIEVFVRRGLVPDAGGAWLLPRLVGLQRAKELMFLGDDVPAARAEQLGLVNRVVPAEALDAAVAEWAERLASGPTRSVGLAKRLLNRSLDVDRETAFDDEALAQELNMGTHDAGEGVQAFVERRSPYFHGW